MKTGQTTKTLLGMALAGLLFAGAVKAQTLAALEQTHAQALSAKTTAEHAAVAKQYRQQAEALAAKATEQEKGVKESLRAMGPLPVKWPGMAAGLVDKQKAKAVEMRRAANEAQTLADKHIRLAVEAQANTPSTPVTAD